MNLGDLEKNGSGSRRELLTIIFKSSGGKLDNEGPKLQLLQLEVFDSSSRAEAGNGCKVCSSLQANLVLGSERGSTHWAEKCAFWRPSLMHKDSIQVRNTLEKYNIVTTSM